MIDDLAFAKASGEANDQPVPLSRFRWMFVEDGRLVGC
jgi:hypothetical protein